MYRVARYSRATGSTVICFCRINHSIWMVPAVVPYPFALLLLPGPSVYTSGAAHPTALLALFPLPFSNYSYNKCKDTAQLPRSAGSGLGKGTPPPWPPAVPLELSSSFPAPLLELPSSSPCLRIFPLNTLDQVSQDDKHAPILCRGEDEQFLHGFSKIR